MNPAVDVRDQYWRVFGERASTLTGAGLPWLARRRRDAIEEFVESGFPTRRDEDWKYTDVSAWAQPADRSEQIGVDVAAIDALRGESWQLVFVDGRFNPALSRLKGLPGGVRVTSLADRLMADPAFVEHRLGRHVHAGRDAFAALNLAFIEDGAVIDIAPGIEVERPIQLIDIASSDVPAGRHLRSIVVLGAGAKACLIDTSVGTGSVPVRATGMVEMELQPASELTHLRWTPNDDAARIETTYVELGRDSRYAAHAFTFGGKLVRRELDVALTAPGADCQLHALSVARGETHIDVHTRFDHRAPHTTSREWVRGIVDDAARSVFSGRVVVHPDAQGSDALQNCRHLLLSPRAEADSRPQLEIYADDVKCAHGAATGSIDPEQLFYLRSRGLPAAAARRLLVHAFAAVMFERMPSVAWRERLAAELDRQLLPGAIHVGGVP